MNVCAILMLSMASIMCSVIGSVKTFFRPLSLSPPSEFIEERRRRREQKMPNSSGFQQMFFI